MGDAIAKGMQQQSHSLITTNGKHRLETQGQEQSSMLVMVRIAVKSFPYMLMSGLTFSSQTTGFSWIGCYRDEITQGVRALSDDKLPEGINVIVEACAQYGESRS